ncbi:MAG TPA: 4a-hydroxytetrahydrobiopterin dehydratase [Pseudonocardiaceae bacterium]
MSELLGDMEIEQGIAGLTGWARDGDSLVRTVELDNFPQAIMVVARVGELAERADHHPDIDIRWRTLTFRCSTHSAGGITTKDLTLAGDINTTIDAIRA